VNDPNAPRYKPTHVIDSNSYDPVRGTHRTKQVHYRMADGTRSYVEIPVDQYGPEAVKEALDKAADVHEAVMQTNPNMPAIPLNAQPNPWGS
jgi:hypothetical protein